MVEFLTILHKSIMKYYVLFADQRLIINFDQYMKFCIEFCIFPDLITKPLLHRIFHTLANLNDMSYSQGMISVSKSVMGESFKDVLDEHLFVESLAICAL